MEIQILGAGSDARAECDYCGTRPFEAYARYGLPVGQFALDGAKAVVCGDCLEALKGLDAAGPQTLCALAGEQRERSAHLVEASEESVLREAAGALLNRIRFPQGTPDDWAEREDSAGSLLEGFIGKIMGRSSAEGAPEISQEVQP